MTRPAAAPAEEHHPSPALLPAPDPEGRRLLAAIAEILSYPGERTARALDEVETLVAFRGFSPAALEELYTATFDLQPTCAPYIGHQLLGEDTGRRGPFLARLAEIYARDGFTAREELPDHVAEVLRFLSVAPPGAERDDLVRDGLLPALDKMIDGLDDRTNPYREALALARGAVQPVAVETLAAVSP